MPFLMIRDDITRIKTDAIVNPANEDLTEGRGTSRGIFLAAGEEKLTAACRKIGHCQLGKAVATKGFDLPADYIIHAVCPVWSAGGESQKEVLYRTYMAALDLAWDMKLSSVAFPLLSTGSYCWPKNDGVRIAVEAAHDFLAEHEMMIYLVLYDGESLKAGLRFAYVIEEYINDHYVAEKDESFFANASMPMPVSGKKKRSLDDLMKHMDETFSQMLIRLIDERGLKDAYVYKKANIDRRHFSKIKNNEAYVPNKRTVLAFALALELSLDETKDLLKRAGFALSNSSKFDVIICYFLENHIYDIYEINEVLFAYQQPLIGM